MRKTTLTILFALSVITISASQNSRVYHITSVKQQLLRNKNSITQISIASSIANKFQGLNAWGLNNPFRPKRSYKKAMKTFDESILLNTLEKLSKRYSLNNDINTELVSLYYSEKKRLVG